MPEPDVDCRSASGRMPHRRRHFGEMLLMGHADIRTTLRHYARFLPQTETRNLDLLDAFAAQSSGSRVANVS